VQSQKQLVVLVVFAKGAWMLIRDRRADCVVVVTFHQIFCQGKRSSIFCQKKVWKKTKIIFSFLGWLGAEK
jgi:hypothetical protein